MIIYNAVISVCEKGTQPERALELIEEMRRRALESGVIIYNAVLSACEKGMQPEGTLELVEEMRRMGTSPR